VCPVTRRSARERLSPSEVPASPAAAQPGLTPCCAPSREGPVLPGVLCANGSRGHWVPRFRHGLGFSSGPTRLLRPPSAPPFDGVSSSHELPASFRVLRPARCSSYLAEPRDPAQRSKSASLGVPSLIAASTGGVHHSAGNPDPAVTFRPRRFSRPRRFAPPPAFAGLFHPAATSRVCPSGVCPSLRSRTGFPRPGHALLTLGAPACDQRMRPRLQGLAPRRECGAVRDGLGPDRSAPLVGFPLLRVLSPRSLGMPSHPLRFRPSPRGTPRS